MNSSVFLSNFENTCTTFTDGYFGAFCGASDNRCIHSSRFDLGDQLLGEFSADRIRDRIEGRKIRNRGVVVGCDHLIRADSLRLSDLPLQNPAITVAPRSFAVNAAERPTLPTAPMTITVWPALIPVAERSWLPVVVTSGSAAAWIKSSPLGNLRQNRGFHDAKLGVSIIRHSEHLVAGGKAFHSRPNLHHRTREVDSYQARKSHGIKISR